MRRMLVIGLLVVIWLLSLLFCALIPLYFRKDIPSGFGPLLQQVFDTFTQTLATMLAFIFARHTDAQRQVKEMGERSLLPDILAVLLSLIYVGIFDATMMQFATGKLRADEAIEVFRTYRPYLAFLVAGSIAYYFGVSMRQSTGTGPRSGEP